jgi:DNA repair exonuclease SbcCD ATPase subunit
MVIVRQAARLSDYERRHAEDTSALEQERAAVRPGQPCAEAPPALRSEVRPAPVPNRTAVGDNRALAEPEAALQQLNSQIAESQVTIGRLRSQLQDAEQAKQEALATIESLQNSQRESRAQLESVQQELDSARAESQAARERATALATDNAKLKNAVGAQTTDLRRQLTKLQDLDRRRDAYLSSIFRRYSEITEQFRAATAALDSGHGAELASPSKLSLSRIQNVISLAEDDMRRLNELSTQARQIENKLASN